jgi:hypothetical protein
MTPEHIAMWHRMQKVLIRVTAAPRKYDKGKLLYSHMYIESQRTLIFGSEEELRQTLSLWEFTYENAYPELFE